MLAITRTTKKLAKAGHHGIRTARTSATGGNTATTSKETSMWMIATAGSPLAEKDVNNWRELSNSK
jgi:hypothetical protein